MTELKLTMAKRHADELATVIEHIAGQEVVVADVTQETELAFGISEVAATVTILLGTITLIEKLIVVAKALIEMSERQNDPVRALIRGKRDDTIVDVAPNSDPVAFAHDLEEIINNER